MFQEYCNVVKWLGREWSVIRMGQARKLVIGLRSRYSLSEEKIIDFQSLQAERTGIGY